VHDAGFVRRLEPLGDLPTHVDRLVHRQLGARGPRGQVLTRDQLHRDEFVRPGAFSGIAGFRAPTPRVVAAQ